MIKAGKIFVVLITVFLFNMIVLVGCNSKEKPKDTVSIFLESYINNDVDEMCKHILNPNSMVIDPEYEYLFNDIEINLDYFDFLSDFYDNKLVLAVASRLEYKIKKETTNNNSAVVTVLIKTPDMEAIIQDLILDEHILLLNSSELSAIFIENISKKQLIENELQLHLQKVDEKWRIDLENFNVIDVLSGRLLSGYQNMYQTVLNEFKQKIKESK